MREITREQAESLINSSEVVQSTVDYEHNDLVVYFKLANQRSLRVQYNMKHSLKTYFMNGEISISDNNGYAFSQ
jgi:LEA14-like dessication related protein